VLSSDPRADRATAGSGVGEGPAQCAGVPLADQASTLIGLLARELRREDDSRFRNAPLTAAQLAVATALAGHGSLTVGGLADAVCCVPANITALVDRLEDKGLARRSADPTDRRVTAVSLTRAGEEALAATRGRAGSASRLGGALDERRLSELVGLLGTLYLALTDPEARA